jgi:hypothetical protein
MKEKIKKAYTWSKNEVESHPLTYMYIFGVVAGAVSYHVGSTWKRDVLLLTDTQQKNLVSGAKDAIKYTTDAGAFYLLPERILK